MAIGLEDKINVDPASTEFPYGDVRDKTPTVGGTRYDRNTMSDYIQFFHKMMDAAGIVPNGMLDNEYNGWQLFDALQLATGGFTTTIEIGAWDMDTTASVIVDHLLTDHTKIRSVEVLIFNDNPSPLISPLLMSGSINIDNTAVTLARNTGGDFDDSSYSTAANRGYIVIKYVQ